MYFIMYLKRKKTFVTTEPILGVFRLGLYLLLMHYCLDICF